MYCKPEPRFENILSPFGDRILVQKEFGRQKGIWCRVPACYNKKRSGDASADQNFIFAALGAVVAAKDG